MPTYEYECTKGHQFEVAQRITEPPLERCQVCRSKVRRLISSSNFILKGGGWYSDGYSSGGNSKSSGSSGGDSKSSDSSAGDPKSSDSSSNGKSTSSSTPSSSSAGDSSSSSSDAS
jgi:putative FmdB family regulatory protein